MLQECWSEAAVHSVKSGEADLGVVVEGCDITGLWCRPYRYDQLAAVLRDDDVLTRRGDVPEGTDDVPGGTHDVLKGPSVAFADLLGRDLVGLEGSSTLTRLLTAQAAQLMRPMALRVQVRSFEAVCRAVQAGLGIGILPLTAAQSFAHTMHLKVLPLADSWAVRRMQLCTRTQPPSQTPLGVLIAHLEACAGAGVDTDSDNYSTIAAV